MVDLPRNEPTAGSMDEALLSGYLDGELTQSDRQRVALFLESNEEARRLYQQLRETREAALETIFPVTDDQWNEQPRGAVSRGLLYVGLSLLGLAGIGWIALLLVVGEVEPQQRWLVMVPFAAVLGVACLFGSVLIDRLSVRRHDIYRNVKK